MTFGTHKPQIFRSRFLASFCKPYSERSALCHALTAMFSLPSTVIAHHLFPTRADLWRDDADVDADTYIRGRQECSHLHPSLPGLHHLATHAPQNMEWAMSAAGASALSEMQRVRRRYGRT